MTKPRCEQCLYFQPDKVRMDMGDYDEGQCRRNPKSTSHAYPYVTIIDNIEARKLANERVVKAAFEFVANFDWSASDSTSDDRWDAFFEAVESHPDWEGK